MKSSLALFQRWHFTICWNRCESRILVADRLSILSVDNKMFTFVSTKWRSRTYGILWSKESGKTRKIREKCIAKWIGISEMDKTRFSSLFFFPSSGERVSIAHRLHVPAEGKINWTSSSLFDCIIRRWRKPRKKCMQVK